MVMELEEAQDFYHWRDGMLLTRREVNAPIHPKGRLRTTSTTECGYDKNPDGLYQLQLSGGEKAKTFVENCK